MEEVAVEERLKALAEKWLGWAKLAEEAKKDARMPETHAALQAEAQAYEQCGLQLLNLVEELLATLDAHWDAMYQPVDDS